MAGGVINIVPVDKDTGVAYNFMADVTIPGSVQGNVASGATDSGNPVKVGGVYHSTYAALTDGQRGDLQLDAQGGLKVRPGFTAGTPADGTSNAYVVVPRWDVSSQSVPLGIFSFAYNATGSGGTWDRTRGDVNGLVVQPALSTNTWNYAAASGGIVNTGTAVTVKAAAGVGIRNYLMSLQVQTATLGGATELAIRDGAAGTVLWRTQLQTAALPLTTINFEPPLKGTANTLMEVVTLTAVTGGVFVNCQGYTGV